MDFNSFINHYSANVMTSKALAKVVVNMAKALTSIHNPPSSSLSVRTDHPGYFVDSSSKSVIGRPVESFSNIVGREN
jgi:hypothetical protein